MATLAKIDGQEHGNVTSGAGGVYDGVSGTISSVISPVRTGLRALRINPTAASARVVYNISGTVATSAVYIRFNALPAADVRLAFFTNASGNGILVYDVSANQFAIYVGTNANQVNVGPTLAINTWYRVVFEFDTATGTASIRVRIGNGTEATTSRAQVSASSTEAVLGSDASGTMDVVYDDWVVSVIDGDYEQISGTWTNHEVQSLIPSADGTHNIQTSGDFDSFVGTAFSNATTNGNTFIGHRPLQLANTADQVIRHDVNTDTTRYMEFTLENLMGILVPVDVRAYVAAVDAASAGTEVGEAHLLLSDATEVLTTGSLSAWDTTEDPGLTITLKKRMAIPPTGGWDATKVNGLLARVGFGDAAPDRNWIDFMVEVALQETPAAAPSAAAIGRVHVRATASALKIGIAPAVGRTHIRGTATAIAIKTATATGRVHLRATAVGAAVGAPLSASALGRIHVRSTATGIKIGTASAVGRGHVRGIASGIAIKQAAGIGRAHVRGAASALAIQKASGLGRLHVRAVASGGVFSALFGKPVADPLAEWTGTQGDAILTAVAGDAILTAVAGDAVLEPGEG